jgi:hypothetical protein
MILTTGYRRIDKKRNTDRHQAKFKNIQTRRENK